MTAPTPLTFRDVDGLARQASRDALSAEQLRDVSFSVETAGPLVELASLTASGLVPSWLLENHVHAGAALGIARSIATGEKPPAARQGDLSGSIAMSAATTDTLLYSFILAARKAAERAGFSNKAAAQFGAALRELRNNVAEHSLAETTGVIFYLGASNRFDFGVSDQGQGVLSSLRTCSTYSGLSNYGDALRVAVSEGGSRYGPGTMHGYGFRPIFEGLAGYRGYLRWRSGDYSFVIDARDPAVSLGATTQKSNFLGLTLSVSCTP